MKVKNASCIRRLSYKTLMASRKRNTIAVLAIALTALLFTSLFTIAMSINSSFETYTFRQVGGYNHGTFKEVTDEQVQAIAAHPKVKQVGIRRVIGFISTGVFGKVPAEVSFMDENCTKWSYAKPTTGRMAASGKEVTMDTQALRLLGITPEIGAQIPLTFTVGDKSQISFEHSDTFTLVGWWDSDDISPVHYINISEEYAAEIQALGIAAGMKPFRQDLNVMMASSMDIRGQMEQVDLDLGYTWETRDQPNSVRIGVNWGYTSSQLDSKMDFGTVAAIAAFLALVIFTGYLIIYNIFQISVTGDIRYYGLLKTIGVTPRQLKRIIRQQALMLCLLGIPLGLLLGYGAGVLLTPLVLTQTTVGADCLTLSVSPWIFLLSALFALVTVLLSCARPGRIAAKVSPVEATRYTEVIRTGKKRKATRGAGVFQMARANLGRNKMKTALVMVSLALSVVILNLLVLFTGGFDMEKYLSHNTCADFIFSSTDYFRFNRDSKSYFSPEDRAALEANTQQTLSGCGYTTEISPITWVSEEVKRNLLRNFYSDEQIDQMLPNMSKKGDLIKSNGIIEGLDPQLFEKVTVVEGDLTPLFQPDSHAAALVVQVDDYGEVMDLGIYPPIGAKQTITYVNDSYYIDSRTGEKSTVDTPDEYLEYYIADGQDMDYTICAYVTIPHSMSHRYGMEGLELVLPVENMRTDSGSEPIPMFYLFDTPDAAAEAEAEAYLAQLTAGDLSTLMYESKATVRQEFESFQRLFTLMGGLLCAIIGIVGILNFFNAILTGILSRRREFAVLQAVGMTNRQLKAMLVWEGLMYTLGSGIAALLLCLLLNPLVGRLMETMFWFFSPHFTILPVLLSLPLFALLGYAIPAIMYTHTAKQSIVQRLRETET